MALVTVTTLEGEPVEDVANTIFRAWGVGQKGKNEGILLLLAINDHRSRLEVGYGLEPILPDGLDGSILRQMRPSLKQGDYGDALMAAAQTIGNTIAHAKNVAIPATLPHRNPPQASDDIPWGAVLYGGLLLMWVIVSWIRPSRRWRRRWILAHVPAGRQLRPLYLGKQQRRRVWRFGFRRQLRRIRRRRFRRRRRFQRLVKLWTNCSEQLVEKLQKAYGEGLVSVVLYGSAATGEHHARFSDYNILCVLHEITPRELGASDKIFRWWREQGNPAPLLLTEHEVANSTDCFAIEFHDIQQPIADCTGETC